MKIAAIVVGLACAVALTFYVCLFLDTLTTTTEMLPLMADAAIAREAAVTRAQVLERVDFMMLEVDQTRKDVIGLAASGVILADSRIANIADQVDVQLAGIRLDFQRQGDAVNRTLANLRDDVRPVLAEAHELLAQSSGTVAVLRPQALGSLAAFKVTMGETAQAARRFDGTLPRYLALGEEIGANVSKTADNVERLTRPDRWYWKALKTVGPFAFGWAFGELKK